MNNSSPHEKINSINCSSCTTRDGFREEECPFDSILFSPDYGHAYRFQVTKVRAYLRQALLTNEAFRALPDAILVIDSIKVMCFGACIHVIRHRQLEHNSTHL